MKVKKAIILAAGRGTRFLPYTKAVPKELIAVVDKPAIYLVVEEIVKSGITDICIVISREKDEIKRYFGKDDALEAFLADRGKTKQLEIVKQLSSLADFTYVYQPYANGSGGAIALCEEYCNGEPAAVLNADDAVFNDKGDPATKQLVDCFEKYPSSILGVQSVSRQAISKYASCYVVEKKDEKTSLICDVIEKPTKDEQIHSLLAPLGRYVIDGNFFDYMRKTPVAANGELQFTDALSLQAKNQGIYAYEFDGRRYDLGDKQGYLEAVVEYALRDADLGKGFAEYLKNLGKQ